MKHMFKDIKKFTKTNQLNIPKNHDQDKFQVHPLSKKVEEVFTHNIIFIQSTENQRGLQ